MRPTFIAVVSSLVLAACATAPVPTERHASTRAAIRVAEEIGAASVPSAQLHLQLALEGLARAQRLIHDGDNEQAAVALMRAESDAELAVALAKEHRLRVEATQAVKKARALQQGTPGT